VGRKRSKNYTQLYYDSIAKPLYDRSLQGAYPPGSPFKLLNALIGLEEGVIDEKTRITCNHGLNYGARKPFGCHCPYGTRNDLNRAIFESCNAYFGKTYLNILNKYPNSTIGVQKWSEHAKSFGLGNFLNNDLSVGTKGRIPDSIYYNREFGKNGLRSTYIISNSIGQGQVETTPIQLANMTAAIANRGFYYTPHIVKNIKSDSLPKKFTTKRITTISPKYFDPVIEGMLDVYESGTARGAKIEGIDICGKTGTSEVYGKIDGVRTQLDDHSIFVAFAPKDNPKIAIAVFVEHGFWGGRWAAPIASLMIEKYLKGTISRKDLEVKMLNGSLQHVYDSYISGEPFEINRKRPIK
jgi:penicillin-binding protein 2